jgi:hypothetical protein
MATIVVSIICIALIVLGGMTMSQGFLTSADTTALSFEDISVREGEILRTDLSMLRAAHLTWADLIRVSVENSGRTKLASFDKWDFIIHYYDGGGDYHTEWLPFTDETLKDNEWRKARIGLNGPTEFFEPDLLNPEEELVMLARLNPLSGNATSGDIAVATANGIDTSISFWNPGYTLLTPHTEDVVLAGTNYYELVEATPADGAGVTFREDFSENESARKILYNANQTWRQAKYAFPLIGIDDIPSATWTVYYRFYIWGDGFFPRQDGDVCLNIDILVRQADGTVRDSIDTCAASAYIAKGDEGAWITANATCAFPGYAVENEDDYLEIDFYAETELGPSGDSGYIELRIDDGTLSLDDQTRVAS